MGDEVDRQLQRYLMDRRRFLVLGGGAAFAGLLAACGLSSSSSSAPGTGAPTSLPPVGGDLNLYVWEGYDVPDADFKKWLQSQNIVEHTKYITQPEEVPTVLKGPGGDKWDMSYGDNVVLSYYKDLGLIAPMTLDQVPGLAGLMTAFQTHPVEERRRNLQRGPMDLGVHGPHLQRRQRPGAARAGTTSSIPSTRAGSRRSTAR